MSRLVKSFILITIAAFSITACAWLSTEPSIYSPDSYHKLPWAKYSFDEMVARCRHTSLHSNKQWNEYKVRRPLFKVCMEHYGFRYLGRSEVSDNDDPSVYASKGFSSIFYSAPVKQPVTTKPKVEWKEAPVVEEKQEVESEQEVEPETINIKSDKSALYR